MFWGPPDNPAAVFAKHECQLFAEFSKIALTIRVESLQNICGRGINCAKTIDYITE